MATNPIRAESAQTNPLNIFDTFDRDTLASTIEVLIAVLDAREPDPDLEEDDPAGACDEDEISCGPVSGWRGYLTDGPGCAISDCGEYAHDSRMIGV